jgi:MoxR-like ATPase
VPNGRRTSATARTAARRSSARVNRPLSKELFQQRFELMVSNIGKVVRGKDDVIRLALVGVIAQGHILFEDLPGTGKTVLARAIAQTIEAKQSRIQCTPDLLPADITGSATLDRATGEFVFRPGPVFGNIFLADEINRATPKTQSALLEAMQERRVTYDGTVYPLPLPFTVLATQNPIEQAGTFPLPEAQLDRFMFKLSLGFLSREADAEVLLVNRKKEAIESLEAVVETSAVVEMIDWAEDVNVSEPVALYIVDLIHATRNDPAIQAGASARASLALLRASRVLAASQGRDDVLPDDVKSLVRPVLAHRLLLTPDALLRDETIDNVVDRIVTRVKIPVGLGKSLLSVADGPE